MKETKENENFEENSKQLVFDEESFGHMYEELQRTFWEIFFGKFLKSINFDEKKLGNIFLGNFGKFSKQISFDEKMMGDIFWEIFGKFLK